MRASQEPKPQESIACFAAYEAAPQALRFRGRGDRAAQDEEDDIQAHGWLPSMQCVGESNAGSPSGSLAWHGSPG